MSNAFGSFRLESPLYLVLHFIRRHGQWAVGDLIRLLLEGFEGNGGRGAPLLARDDRTNATVLVGGVKHRHSLGA